MIQKYIGLFTFVLFSLVSNSALADDTAMNDTLVRIIHQVDALMPLIDMAESQQNKGAALQFHFETFTTSDGQTHNGLRQDLLAIRRALVAQINQAPIAPRTVQPIEGDYVGNL